MSAAQKSGLRLLVTGLPAAGKSQLAQQLAREYRFAHLDVSAAVRNGKLYSAVDEALESTVFDEDRVVECIETFFSECPQRHCVVDFHSPESFPLFRWFDAIVWLEADLDVLVSRYKARGYSEAKIDVNVAANNLGYMDNAVLGYFEETELPYRLVPDDCSETRCAARKALDGPWIYRRGSNCEEDTENLLRELERHFSLRKL